MAQTARRSRVPPPFEAFAYLHRPADADTPASIVEAGPGWSPPTTPDGNVDVLLWGRLARNARPTLGLVAEASRRELAVRRIQSTAPPALRLVGLHRLAPARRPGVLRTVVRSATLGGVLAEFVRSERPRRVIDEVALAACDESGNVKLRPSGDGSALASLIVGGERAELRVAQGGHPKDPARGRKGLQALAAADVRLVPRPLAGGTTAGASWATETAVPGEHVRSLSPKLLADVTAFLATLPAAPAGHRTALEDHLAEVAAFFPERRDTLAWLGEAASAWSTGLDPVLIHGDLWLNNIFMSDGRVSGIFDWHTWHPAGLPATDLLNLLASDRRATTGLDFGVLLVDGFWRSPAVVDAIGGYFRARDRAAPDAAGIAAIAAGWWASRVAGALHRALRQIDDPDWVDRNLVRALPVFERLERELR